MKKLKFLASYLFTQWAISIHRIRVFLNIIDLINKLDPPDKWELYWRGLKHDWSKLGWYEAEYYSQIIFKLKHSTYGSDEYKKMLKYIQPAIKHHFEPLLPQGKQIPNSTRLLKCLKILKILVLRSLQRRYFRSSRP